MLTDVESERKTERERPLFGIEMSEMKSTVDSDSVMTSTMSMTLTKEEDGKDEQNSARSSTETVREKGNADDSKAEMGSKRSQEKSIEARRKKRRKTIAKETMEMENLMKFYEPIVPEALTSHLLKKSGFKTDDTKVVRLVSALSRYFVQGIVDDAFQFHNLRQKTISSTKRDKTLKSQDLSISLKENRVLVTKPECFVER